MLARGIEVLKLNGPQVKSVLKQFKSLVSKSFASDIVKSLYEPPPESEPNVTLKPSRLRDLDDDVALAHSFLDKIFPKKFTQPRLLRVQYRNHSGVIEQLPSDSDLLLEYKFALPNFYILLYY